MTRPEIREALSRLPVNERRELEGIAVHRPTRTTWSINDQPATTLEGAVVVYETLRRLRAPAPTVL